jgi:hypothetical protein
MTNIFIFLGAGANIVAACLTPKAVSYNFRKRSLLMNGRYYLILSPLNLLHTTAKLERLELPPELRDMYVIAAAAFPNLSRQAVRCGGIHNV